jgi:predicted alpha-1,6-mannanase (GH76 family)
MKSVASFALNVLTSTMLAITVTSLPSTLCAQNQADDTYNAFNAAFLVKSQGKTYYKSSTVDSSILRSWGQCLEIAVVEDVYERTYDPEQGSLVNSLLNNAMLPENDGKDWTRWDTWNDDIAWMGIAFIRGYKITGRSTYLTVVENNWNSAYDRGWDKSYGGGGIWECMDNLKPGGKPSKCALSNNPMVTIGCALYQATGDETYLTKSEQIYAWVREHLFDQATGQVNEGLSFPGYDTDTKEQVQRSDNVYNSGSFIEAANCLYEMTGDKMYYEDALRAIKHIVREGPILHNDAETSDNQWAYRFIRGLAQFCNDNHYWGEPIPGSGKITYYAWMLGNADAAWNSRDSLNLTWNDWTRPTTDPKPNGVECSSAVSIWQALAIPPEEQIINK